MGDEGQFRPPRPPDVLNGLYLSAHGASARAHDLDVTAANMANAGTAGFKRDLALFAHHAVDRANRASVPPNGLGRQTGGATLEATAIDLSQGPLESTGGDLDLALAGPGFLRVGDGTDEYLTRDGRLTLGPTGELLTAAGGLAVLDPSGTPIQIPPDAASVEFAADGTVSARAADGTAAPLARLDVVLPDDPASLIKVGANRFTHRGGVLPADPRFTAVRQGHVEGSGVDPIDETLAMIDASRAFELNLNLVKLQDETLAGLLAAARP